MRSISILDFDNTYKSQKFYQNKDYEIIDLSDLKNVSRYCDKNSLNIIRERVNSVDFSNIKFMNSGNYHYVSYLMIEKIKEPFILVLFDHHTDMQASCFSELMSCGSWVRNTLEDNQYIQKVIIIGAKDTLINLIENKYQDKVISFSEEEIKEDYNWQEFAENNLNLPIYISIDKDVLTSKEVKTDWDQGSLSLKQLKEIYISISENHKILGIDICGDASNSGQFFEINNNNYINDKSNQKILDIIESQEKACYQLSTV